MALALISEEPGIICSLRTRICGGARLTAASFYAAIPTRSWRPKGVCISASLGPGVISKRQGAFIVLCTLIVPPSSSLWRHNSGQHHLRGARQPRRRTHLRFLSLTMCLSLFQTVVKLFKCSVETVTNVGGTIRDTACKYFCNKI